MHKLLKALTAILLALAPAAAFAGEQIKLKAEPAQAVMMEDENGRAYIRVSVEGIPYAEEHMRTPVNVALVIDKSGSMTGSRIEHAKQAAMMALSRLKKDDIVSVVAFNHNVETLVPAGPYENAGEMNRRIERLSADGYTAIHAGVSQGAQEISGHSAPDRFSRVILLSDGQANVGPSSPAQLETLGRELGGKGISVTTLGLGDGYNEELMVRLATASDGNHAFVQDPEQLTEIFNREFDEILSVVGQDAEIIIECPEGIKPLRSLGHEAAVSGQRVSFKLNQVYGGQRKYVVIELDVAKDKARTAASLAQVRATYTDPRTKQRLPVNSAAEIRFSTSKEDAARSVNSEVMTSVALQLATQRYGAAVKLRDQGKTEEAKRELLSNAEYLNQQADILGNTPDTAPLRMLAQRNQKDAAAVTSNDWNLVRKDMLYQEFSFGASTKF